MIAKLIHIKGLVQGVGFRPFIYRIAVRNNLKGWVDNRNDGVYIFIEGVEKNISCFLKNIKNEAPPASSIDKIEIKNTSSSNYEDFQIVKSKNTSDSITDVSPDIAVCHECLADLKVQQNRINYPFINCTNCGPRFTIIEDLPYDREKTSMQPFLMCEKCNNEYIDILDRRFHAQPVACELCGPKYSLNKGKKQITEFSEILINTTEIINSGGIVAIKGMGGFYMACDALNENAVKRLRSSKERENKPFAVMFKDIESVKDFCDINKVEEELLLSWRRPIVLLKAKKAPASEVSMGFPTLGVMLPYMPLHYLLFEKLKTSCIVLTSGNLSDEPIIIKNQDAINCLGKISDAVLTYNREIYNRNDDSVLFVANKKPRLIRRSRAYVPNPINLPYSVDGIIATGAELVNCFCIGKEKQAIISQHIGDLKNAETLDFYTEALQRFQKLFRLNPKVLVCDLHPDYLSSRYAQLSGLNVITVQHHHAHIASCMAEHNLNEDVIGVAMDGTGLGSDGNIWGGEFLICDLEKFERVSHFQYLSMPGGDRAAKQVWRMGLSYLYKAYGEDLFNLEIPFVESLHKKDSELLIQAINKKINSPLTSSAGRLFDAVAAIANICTTSTFHAEAPMRLEAVADNSISDFYPFETDKEVSFLHTIRAIVDDIQKKIPNSIISAKFHNSFVNAIFETVWNIHKNSGLKKVALSGGTFQNKFVLEKLETKLQESGLEVFAHEKIPSNDAGIALGQLVVGANSINSKNK